MKKKQVSIEKQNELFAFKKQSSEWKALFMRGDLQLIADIAGVSKVTIAKAIKKGTGSYDVLVKVKTFYENRKQFLKSKSN